MEEKKLFENKTTYTSDTYVEFLKFHNKKYNFSYILYTIFWSFLFFLCIIISFSSNARLQGVLLTIVLICFITYRIVRPKMIVNNELSSDKFSDNNTNTFTFYNKYFEIKNKNGKFNYKYFMLFKVFENTDFYYLYISKENAFLISKHAFSIGTSDEFAKFIKSKCGLKCKITKTDK